MEQLSRLSTNRKFESKQMKQANIDNKSLMVMIRDHRKKLEMK